MKRLISLLVYLLIALLIIGTGYLMFTHQQGIQQENHAMAALEEARRPLLAKQLELTTQIAQLEQQQMKLSPAQMGILILFTEPDQRIMTEALPMMERFQFVGTIAVSDTFFPGEEGMLTVNELQQLITLGWDICVTADQHSDAAALSARLTNAGFAAPEAAYFPNGDCTLSNEAALAQLGVKTILQYGASSPCDGSAAALFFIPVYGTMDEASGEGFDYAYANKTKVAFSEGWQQAREAFTQSDFRDNLELFSDYVRLNHAVLTNIDTAYTQHTEAEAFRQAHQESWQQQHDDLTQQLQGVEQKLLDLTRMQTAP